MRAVATLSPGALPGPEVAADAATLSSGLDELAALGWIPGEPGEPIIADALDPTRPDSGVELHQHPDLGLAQDPDLALLCGAWRLGYHRTPEPSELRDCSAVAIDALALLRAADHRAAARRVKAAQEAARGG